MKKAHTLKLRKLQRAHYTIGIIFFLLVFGAIGLTLEFTSHAATGDPEIQSLGIGGTCITVAGTNGDSLVANALVEVAICKGNANQKLSVSGSGSTIRLIYSASNGDHCLEPLSGAKTAGSKVVSNSVATCNGHASDKTEYWEANGKGFESVGAALCLATSGSGSTSLTIAKCATGTNTDQQWAAAQYGVTPTPPPPTPTPTPTPTPPKPKPTPPKKKPSNPPLTVTSSQPPPTATPTLNDTPSTSDTSNTTENLGGDQALPSTTPVISGLSAVHVTETSVQLKWHANIGSSYIIRYGLSLHQMTTTSTLNTNETNVSVTISHLPAGKQIYLEVTPENGGALGDAKQVSFKTSGSKSNIFTPIVLSLLVVAIIIVALIKLIGRKTVVPEQSDELPLPDAPAFPQEDKATYNARVNWWLPENQRQPGQHQKQKEEFPDMFEAGEQRLEEEEKKRPPKS